MTLLYILLASITVGLISCTGVLLLGFRIDVRRLTFYLISLASGSLLGAAFLHLLPEILENPISHPFRWVAGGILLFFILEKLVIWRHCHHHQRPADHKRPVASAMILVGDAVHNFIDGMIIASSFMVSSSLGVSVTLAIILHEIPQELGDFGVLIHGGYSVKKAVGANLLTAATSLIGALITYFFVSWAPAIQLFILPIAVGGFLYIAMADLIPQLHEQIDLRSTLAQILLLLFGFGIMLAVQSH